MMTRSTNTQGTAARMSAITGMALIFGALALMSHHNGVAEEQNKDRTGAPGSQQPCSACHNSGSYDVTPSISVYPFEGADTPVTTFVPFTEYYVVFEVDASGAPAGYGFQATAVFGNGDNAGTFISCTDNAQLEDVNGRHIVEQNDLSPSNTFGLFWGAPAGGEGPVTFYASMLASNGAYGNAGDSYAGTLLTLDEAVTDIECPDCLDSDESLKAWATDECAAHRKPRGGHVGRLCARRAMGSIRASACREAPTRPQCLGQPWVAHRAHLRDGKCHFYGSAHQAAHAARMGALMPLVCEALLNVSLTF